MMRIKPFYDTVSGTVSYVLSDGRHAAVIDAVLDYDPESGHARTDNADALVAYVRGAGLEVQWILETHAHTDHLSGAAYVKSQVGGRTAIGERIREVQAYFRVFYHLERSFLPDGSQFDHLFQEGERFRVGRLEVQALWVPGHTPADLAYRVEDAVFVGDTMFMPDVGTARCDFPGGSARALYRSIRRLLALPDATRLFVCHDYPPQSRAAAWQTTVAAQKAHSIHVRDGVTEDEFVAMREARDATLAPPRLILPALQVNIRAGRLPPAEDNGVSYLKIPLNALDLGRSVRS